MASVSEKSRRQFLNAAKASIANVVSFVGFAKISAAQTGAGVFAQQFLEEGKIVKLPPGYYDPAEKEFVLTGSEGSSKIAARMSGIRTASYEERCLYTEPNSSQCAEYETVCRQHGWLYRK